MRPRLPRIPALLLTPGLALLLALAPGGAAPRRGGPPPVRAYVRDCAGKPHAAVGEILLSVVERPAYDEVVLRADWTLGALADQGAAALEVALPEGAWIVAGQAEVALPPGLAEGASTWIVRFPADRTLDAVVRLRIDGPDATYRRESVARLWEVPPE